MHGVHLGAVILFCVVIVLSLTFNVPSAKSGVSSTLFSDDFNQPALDNSVWVAQQNVNGGVGGSISINNSYVYLTSYGTSFPCVYTAQNPFPTSGDFTVEFDIQYTQLTGYGTGLWITQGAWTPTAADEAPNIFRVWGGNDGGIEGGYIYVQLFGEQVYKQTFIEDSHTLVSSSDLEVFRIQYSQGIYEVYLNGDEIASQASSMRADTIGFGEAACSYLPVTFPGPWSSFQMNSIRVLEPSTLSIVEERESNLNGQWKVNIAGTLTDLSNEPLCNASIVLYYQVLSTKAWNIITEATTDSKGIYSATWFAPATGTYIMKAEWIGNEIYGGTLEFANISIAQGTQASAPSETSTITASNNSATIDQSAVTGVNVTVSGSSLQDGTQLNITSTNYGATQPSGTGTVLVNGTGFYDVSVTSSNGTLSSDISVTMNISNPTFTNASLIEYWNGNLWVSVASTFTAPDTVSGTVPATALTGTPIVVGTSKQNSTSMMRMIEVIFALIAGLIIAAVAVAQLMWISKNRKASNERPQPAWSTQ